MGADGCVFDVPDRTGKTLTGWTYFKLSKTIQLVIIIWLNSKFLNQNINYSLLRLI